MKLKPIFVCLFFLAGCLNQQSNHAIAPFEPGLWSGTFKVGVKEGTIKFLFTDSIYSYTGRYNNALSTSSFLDWTGSFQLFDGSVILHDNEIINPQEYVPSLRLNSIFAYSFDGTIMTISTFDPRDRIQIMIVLHYQGTQPFLM